MAITLRRLALLVPVLALALTVGTAPAQATETSPSPSPSSSGSTGDRTTWGIQPADSVGAPPRPYFNLALEPGATLRDSVRISNFSAKRLTLTAYATDAYNSSDGGFSLLSGAERPVDVGSWVKLQLPESGSLTLPARTSIDVPFVLTVPDDATPGDHVGGIVASYVSGAIDDQGNRVDVDQRVGARVYLRVAGVLDPALAVSFDSARYEGRLNPLQAGDALVEVTVRNEGNVMLAGRQTVSVEGPFGLGGSEAALDLPPLLPGNTATVSVPVPGVVPLLLMDASVVVSPQAVQDTDPGAPVSASSSFWAWPLPQLAGLLLLIILIAVLRRRSRPEAVPAGRHGSPAPAPLEPVS